MKRLKPQKDSFAVFFILKIYSLTIERLIHDKL
jgi:hypothetical protein